MSWGGSWFRFRRRFGTKLAVLARLGASWERLVACLRADLDGLVTQGQASWADVLRLSSPYQQPKSSRGSKLSIYQDIGLDLLY